MCLSLDYMNQGTASSLYSTTYSDKRDEKQNKDKTRMLIFECFWRRRHFCSHSALLFCSLFAVHCVTQCWLPGSWQTAPDCAIQSPGCPHSPLTADISPLCTPSLTAPSPPDTQLTALTGHCCCYSHIMYKRCKVTSPTLALPYPKFKLFNCQICWNFVWSRNIISYKEGQIDNMDMKIGNTHNF